MSDILSTYKLPYADILGTKEQTLLEESLHPICENYRLYDESKMFDIDLIAKLREILKDADSHEIILLRNILRADKTHLIPEIPEAWWWIFFWRMIYNFHYEPDPWFEVKWWMWLEVRGKQECMNMIGCQNCLGEDIPVMMADGSRKLSQDVQIGDLLMGPDSTPREVLVLHQGEAPLYRISPKVGTPWICTENHKLELGGINANAGPRIKVTPAEWLEWPDPMRRSYTQVYGKGFFGDFSETGIDVEPIGVGNYFGWTVDKDNMFLLGDGCITNNSGKSGFSSWFAIVQLIVWDKDCKAYLSGPYKSHTDDKLWGELETNYKTLESKGVNPSVFGISPILNKNQLTVSTKTGDGIIKFIASQEASSVVGSKTKDHRDTTGRKGISLFIVDEYVENTNTDMGRGFGNFRSNYNSILILACNPDPMRALHPNVVAFIDPMSKKRADMRKDIDFKWRTRKGVVVRFDWNNCPNRILGKNRWTYLMNEQRREKQLLESDDVRAGQLDAWPFGSEGANCLTDLQRQISAGVFSDFVYENAPHQLIMAVDPAFGGDDPAVYTLLEVAKVNVDGNIRTRFVGKEQGYIEGIDRNFIADTEFTRKVEGIISYRRSKGDRDTQYLSEITIGSPVGPMAQGAVEAAHLCISKGVPFDCFTYDASQRADCHDWMVKVFGRKNIIWWYEGSRRLITEEGDEWVRWPYRTREDKREGSRHERWSDYCGRTITMLWAFACELTNNGYLANGSAVQKSLDELGAREVAASNSGKMEVWSKADIKRGIFQGKKIPKMQSPAWAETFAMAVYLGVRFKNSIELGERPELSHHVGAGQADYDDWLELHSRY